MNVIDLTEEDYENEVITNSTSATSSFSSRGRRNRRVLDDNDDDEYAEGTGVRRSKRQRLRRLVSEIQETEKEEKCDDMVGTAVVSPKESFSDNNDEFEFEEDEAEERSPSPVISSATSTTSNSVIPTTTTKTTASPAKIKSYLQARHKSITTRTFDLSLIPSHEIFPTGRTIKKMTGWSGSHWPALRELMQNTIDHLGLLDSKTGRRHAALDLNVTTTSTTEKEEEKMVVYTFTCQKETICVITVQRDCITIEQMYTYPLPSRALDTGVEDDTKANSTSTAGGFGDGFKTAALALHSLGSNKFESMVWTFDAKKEERRITWFFESEEREAVGKFAKSNVLRVRIEHAKNSRGVADGAEDDVDGYCGMGKNYVMTQTVKAKDIGKSFVTEAVPRLQVFWDVDDSTVIGTSTVGGDYIGPASLQPSIPGTSMFSSSSSSSSSRRGQKKASSAASLSSSGKNLKPEPGIYVRGIWVRKPSIPNTLMCFFGSRLQVSGRDRNDVHEEELIDAVAYIFRKCSDLKKLKTLLEPLRGRRGGTTSNNNTSARITRGGGGGSSSESWLLKSPRFLNHLWMMDKNRDFVLYDVLQIPKNAIFVSSRTTKSSDPFLRWASDFLQKKGAPLVPIESGANRYLFEEVNEVELADRCVRILNDDLKRKDGDDDDEEKRKHLETLRVAFRKILVFMGLGGTRRGTHVCKVLFSPDVTVAFVHNGKYVFVPEAPLTRELLVKVLNVCQCHLDGADGEKFSSLVQALFETLPAGRTRTLTVEDVEKVVVRAKEVTKENANFLVQSRGEQSTSNSRDAGCCGTYASREKDPGEVMDLTGEGNKSPSRSSRRGGGAGLVGLDRTNTVTPSADLEAQIARVTKKAGRKRKGTSGDGDDGLDSIIPETNFASDNAGSDTCLRPSSALCCISVDASLGGGSLLCNERTVSDIQNGAWTPSTKARLAALRQILNKAVDVVQRSTPSLAPLLSRIRHGYDSSNDTYEAFCDGKRIVVNLYTYMPRLSNRVNSISEALAAAPKTLLHDFVVTITHEIAHFLQPGAGHGPVWRDSHMAMLVEVMAMLEVKELVVSSSSSS